MFVNPSAKELEGRARQLLRNAYIDSKLITFDPSYVNQFMSHIGPLDSLGRGCDYGVSVMG